MAQAKKYIITLTDLERTQLTGITSNHRHKERERNRARILLLSEQGYSDQKVADEVGCHWMTVRNTRLKFHTQPVSTPAKHRVKRANQVNRSPRALDGEKEARLVALACSAPPDGASRWTLQLLKDRLIALELVEVIGKETIRRTLKKMNLSLGRKSAGAFPLRTTPAS
jgi:transposase